MFPVARSFDIVTHDMVTPCGFIAGPASPPTQGAVIVEGLPAAYVGCLVMCTGATSAGPVAPAHPPGAPPFPFTSAGGGGSGGAADPSISEEKQADSDADSDAAKRLVPKGMKTIHVRARKAKASIWSVRFYSSLSREIWIEMFDPSNGDMASYKYEGRGDISNVGWHPSPWHDEVSHGGEWKNCLVAENAKISDFEGWASYDDEQTGPVVTDTKFKFGHSYPELPVNMPYGSSLDLGPTLGGGPTVAQTTWTIGFIKRTAYLPGLPDADPPPPLGPPAIVPIVSGSTTVFIHGQPAARWAPSGDGTACGASLGHIALSGTRTVFIG